MNSPRIPFVRNHSASNSKIVFICICCDLQILSEIFFIHYTAPPLSCKEPLSLHLLREKHSKIILSVSVSAMNAKMLRKYFSVCRGRELNVPFFSQTFRAPPGYPGKIPGYPAKKVRFPWFRGTYRTFWPPPLHVEDPYPTGKYPDSKVWVCALFSRN